MRRERAHEQDRHPGLAFLSPTHLDSLGERYVHRRLAHVAAVLVCRQLLGDHGALVVASGRCAVRVKSYSDVILRLADETPRQSASDIGRGC